MTTPIGDEMEGWQPWNPLYTGGPACPADLSESSNAPCLLHAHDSSHRYPHLHTKEFSHTEARRHGGKKT